MIPNQDLLNHDLILIEALLCLLEENRKAYETLFVDGNDFEQIGEDFEKCNTVNMVQIGNATVKLMNQRQLVDYAEKWMEENR